MRPVALILVLGLAAIAVADEPAPRTRVPNCTTSGCHADQMNHQFLHGPTAVSACDACHEYKDPVQHTFGLKREGLQLCVFCHIDVRGTEGPVVHPPVAEGKCLSCHDPHGSHTREMLRQPTVNAMCLSCHEPIMSGSHAHKPAAEDCTACHEAHTAQHKGLLRTPGRDLCLSCHTDVSHDLTSRQFPHKPAEGDCLVCHSPHSSNAIDVLKQPPRELCVSCHADIGRTISSATHPHVVTSDEKACLNCHTAHASDHATMLIKDPIDTCLDCHKAPIVVDDKKTVPGVPELAAPNMFKHGPVEQGDCSACHTVHGGSLSNLLVEPYPASFYQTYTDDAYALCFKCHDKALMQQSDDAATQTRFRDGTRNLHAVHVTATPQGRSCRACHAVHASRFPTLIADSVSFGQWKLPLNYAKTDTGGSCASGCHKPESYDRVTPMAVPLNDAAPPPPQPQAPEPQPAPPAGSN